MASDFFSKTRLILLSPNVSTGLFSIEVRRCIDPIDQLSFFQVSQKVINKKLTFETDSTTSTSIDRDISLKSDVTCENARHMDCEPFINIWIVNRTSLFFGSNTA